MVIGNMENFDSIDWNQMSELTLIRRINTEILHPLGLAISRTKEGISEKIIIAPDGVFNYEHDVKCLSDSEIKQKLSQMKK